MSRIARSVALGLGFALLALAALMPLACQSSPRQTTVIPESKVEQDPGRLTPLQRGRIRTEVVGIVGKAMAAWRARDLKAMNKFFSATRMADETALQASHVREGRKRVRSHADISLDVVEMTPKGDQVALDYSFKDLSYWSDIGTGARVSKPTKKDTNMRILARKTKTGWTITTLMSGREALL